MKFDDRIQHGNDWQGQDLSGWLMSEKLDGVRMYWDGEQALTRQGRVIDLPESWRAALPAGVALDGELFSPRGLALASNAARYGCRHFHQGMQFVVFDAPSAKGTWPERLDAARRALVPTGALRVVDFWVAESNEQVVAEMKRVQKRGGEGLIARHPALSAAAGRTQKLLKVKKCPVKKAPRKAPMETLMTFSFAV